MHVTCHLREIRERAQLSIRDIAERTGIDRGTLSYFELGRQLPKDDVVPMLEEAYGAELARWYEWRGPAIAVEFDEAEAA
jgi:transcriptional regulator with XRE-family HTH domain